MMDRITNKDLERMIKELNHLTNNPIEPYTKTDAGYTANLGHYHIDAAYGGVKLAQITSDGGGERDISHDGYGTKRQLYAFLQAYIEGIRAGKV
ncbi:MAG: hypothetical protein WC554_16885 [Clostridia bacterium]